MKRLRVPDRRTICPSGKVRYLSHSAATLRLLRIQGHPSTRDKQPIRVYACERCGGHHLTSQPPRVSA